MDITSESVHHGIRERAAFIVGSTGRVPLILWTPEHAAPTALVLVGHGGSGHKKEDFVVALARRMVRTRGFAVAAIDGPVHGERRSDTFADPVLVLMQFAQAWGADPEMTNHAVTDWTATLDSLQGFDDLADRPVGFWGLSMGTILGLPFVAADHRIKACVLGLAGITGPTSARLERDAPNVTVPTLFHVQLDDEIFATEGSLALFRMLGSEHKRLFAAPGRHRDVPKDAVYLSIDFLAEHLGPQEAPQQLDRVGDVASRANA